MRSKYLCSAAVMTLLALSVPSQAANIYGLKPGQPDLKSAGPLAFGSDGVLFIGDPLGAAVFAVETKDKGDDAAANYQLAGVNQKVADFLGVAAEAASVSDLIVNPETGHVFLAVTVTGQSPRIVKLDGSGKLSELKLDNILFSKADLPNAAEDKEVGEGRRRRNNRLNSVTDLAYFGGQVIVTGLSNEQSASNVWSLMFPFQKVDKGTTVEIFHGNHGQEEDYAPITTFVPFIVNGEPNLLAGYVCTPLVKFPLKDLAAAESEKVRGTTVAELGNRNKPLDMITYEKDGQHFLLLSNSARGVMKVSTDNIGRSDGIIERVSAETAGQSYEKIEELKGVVQMDKLNDSHAVVIIQGENGSQNLMIVELP